MLEQVTTAFERKDYRTVAQLLKQWQQTAPKDPWFQLCVGRFQEETGKAEAAAKTYRKLLKATTHKKVLSQARQGIQRLEEAAKAERQAAIAQAKAGDQGTESGLLILEPVPSDQQQVVAQGLATVMKLDPYTARMHLPRRGWRLYRTGPLGELQVYGQELQAAQVPVFWIPLSAVLQVQVFRVEYFQAVSPQPVAVCKNAQDQLGAIAFDWSEVSQRVQGGLPLFESVVDLDARGKLQRKEKTQDYVQMCDLHLPGRGAILRLCDRTYQFQKGAKFTTETNGAKASASGQLQAKQSDGTLPGIGPTSTRLQWNHLLAGFDQQTAGPSWSEFTYFAEGALEYLDLLNPFNPHIDIIRREQTHWDAAFHLYSGLLFHHSPAVAS